MTAPVLRASARTPGPNPSSLALTVNSPKLIVHSRFGRRTRLSATATLAITLLGLALPAVTSAHPLGNFTINRYDGLTVSSEWTHIDRVVDMAELPTVQARQQMDADHNGDVSATEGATWADSTCRSATDSLSLTVAGSPVVPQPTALGLSFAPGQAGLQTLRLVCSYRADYSPAADAVAVQFSDSSYQTRQGWREIVVRGDDVDLAGADAFQTGTSDRLRAYPVESSGAIRAQFAAEFSISRRAGASISALPVVDDAVALGSPAEEIVGLAPSAATVPGGVADLPGELTRLIGAADLSLPAIVIALMLAAFVGAFHAATPGHGKTLMAAYLVGSRGTVRHALGLGLTVTVSHTIGVLALGAIVLIAGAALPSERLLPILGLVSGVIVTILGAVFLFQRVQAARQTRAAAHAHADAHEHDLPHDHDDHAHDHSHDEPNTEGWHSHGLLRHTHLPAADGPLRRRNLIALGLVGGLVPSASAILILVGSIAAGKPAFGIALTIAFGMGMAAVLVGVGVLLVRARSLVERLPSRNLGRVLAYAPLATALVFVVVGVTITIQAAGQLR